MVGATLDEQSGTANANADGLQNVSHSADLLESALLLRLRLRLRGGATCTRNAQPLDIQHYFLISSCSCHLKLKNKVAEHLKDTRETRLKF